MADEAYLFRLEAEPPAYIWSGVGDLDVLGDALVGPATTRYVGIGTLGDIPELQNLINGVADRVNFTLSGVDPLALGYAYEDREAIVGSIIRIGSWDYQNPVDWEWEGIADTITVESQGGNNGARTRSVIISAGTATTTRSTTSLNFFTDADQHQRSPSDTFFSHVAGIQNTSRRFGAR